MSTKQNEEARPTVDAARQAGLFNQDSFENSTTAETSATEERTFGPQPPIYPDHPGSREKGVASEDAAKQTAPLANARRAELFAKFLEAGDNGLTADEAIDAVKGDPRAYHRISELIRLGVLTKTPQRRPTARGATATVIKVHPQAHDLTAIKWRVA